MKLSTKGRYGLKAMYYLAQENNLMSLKQLSMKSEIPESYLEKILGLLRKKNLVETTRGALGGYSLSRPVNEISIGEILRALENNLYLAACNGGNCNSKDCPSKNIFNRIYLEINNVLDKIYLSDMLESNKKGIN